MTFILRKLHYKNAKNTKITIVQMQKASGSFQFVQIHPYVKYQLFVKHVETYFIFSPSYPHLIIIITVNYFRISRTRIKYPGVVYQIIRSVSGF